MARRPKLSDLLYSDLLGRIRSGQFAPDWKLPSESELTQRFKVSRPIVREALGRLRAEGIIYSQQGAGSFVAAPAQGDPPAPAPPEVAAPSMKSIADVRRMYDFRKALEGEIAFFAAQNRSDDALVGLRGRLEAITLALRGGQTGVEQDAEFHAMIALATENPFFEAALASVRPHLVFIIDLTRSFAALHSKEHMSRVQREHNEIYDRIEAADPAGAREAMQTHIGNAQDRLFNGIAA